MAPWGQGGLKLELFTRRSSYSIIRRIRTRLIKSRNMTLIQSKTRNPMQRPFLYPPVTAILGRLLVKPEGLGRMMASCDMDYWDLAMKLCSLDGKIEGYDVIGFGKRRLRFLISSETYNVITDVRSIPVELLYRDQVAVVDTLNRVGASGAGANGLNKEEFVYLQRALPEGAWVRLIGVLRPECIN